MIPAHHTESKTSPVTQGVLSSGDYKEIRSVRVGSSSGARELFTRAKGNSRQTALVRPLSRVATSIRMTARVRRGRKTHLGERGEVYDSRYDLL